MPSLPSLPRDCPASLALITINVALYLAQMTTGNLLANLGLLYGPVVQDGQWWRVVTSGFLHGSLLHVGFNMYLLFMLGPHLERSLGSLRFLLVYAGSLAGGALGVMLFAWAQPTLGASGAVLGLAGAMGVAMHERGIRPQQSPVFGLVVLNIALPLLVPGISFWGHLGGILAGMLMGYLLIWLPIRRRQPAGSRAAGNSLSTAGATVVGLFALSLAAALSGGLLTSG